MSTSHLSGITSYSSEMTAQICETRMSEPRSSQIASDAWKAEIAGCLEAQKDSLPGKIRGDLLVARADDGVEANRGLSCHSSGGVGVDRKPSRTLTLREQGRGSGCALAARPEAP